MKNKKKQWLSVVTWGVILGIWFIYSICDRKNTVMIPTMHQVWSTFWDILNQGYGGLSFLYHLRSSFVRLFLAMFSGVLVGVPLGILSGYHEVPRGIVDSFIQFYRPIPPLAYYPLLIIWMGISDLSKVALLFLAAFAPIYISCVSAIEQIRRDYILSAQSLGASNSVILRRIVWPAIQPEVFTGVRTAFGFAYSTLIAAEMTAATSGIGWMVLDASRYLRSDVMFVGIAVMGVSGLVIDRAILYLENTLVFWKGQM